MRIIQVWNLSLWFKIILNFRVSVTQRWLDDKYLLDTDTMLNQQQQQQYEEPRVWHKQKTIKCVCFLFWLLVIFATLEIFIAETAKESRKFVKTFSLNIDGALVTRFFWSFFFYYFLFFAVMLHVPAALFT